MEPGEFIRPPEAPVFQPTLEEFKDPVAYLTKIRPVVLNTGICKIKPPSGWRPPFAVNVDTFRFTPRLQPLNELEAKTRVQLNFLDTLTKFWEMQGVSFKIPNVNRTPLDLHKLYKIVTCNGGFEQVCCLRKWVYVAREMGYINLSVSGSLRINYEKFLFPFEIFQVKNDLLELPVVNDSPSKLLSSSYNVKEETRMEEFMEEMDFQDKNPDSTPRRSKRRRLEDPDYDYELGEDNPEFKKLMFVAPGPKNAYGPGKRSSRQCASRYRIMLSDANVSNMHATCDSLSNVQKEESKPTGTCIECEGDYCPEDLLSCSGCSSIYHTFCLIPRLPCVPNGRWFCSHCIAKECSNAPEAFGFEQAKMLHSLQSFGQMANQFKTDYFSQQPTDVPYATVEKEFWRLVTSIDDEVTVEYGADLHSSKHGSGFPTRDPSTGHVTVPGAEEFADCGWNLNNLPVLKGSVLSYIDVDISGMKVPWLYVGMCFSCFCWHTEDHWTYSINYLHWGEAKTWYGVPSAYADALEATMKEQAPELFENQPDLMHHLVTTLNPSLLMKNGIPVVRTDQCAGEFVVTFPRAYHAGFNQGFNFAEAVNFALADWLPVGRQSIDHYQITQKCPVFSHDELICKMIAKPNDLELSILIMVAKDSTKMLSIEEQLRYSVVNSGLCHDGKEVFELLSDDDRQCCICKTSCFLSGVRCTCDNKRLSCPYHYTEMCHCPSSAKSLRYRYSLEELRQLVSSVQIRANLFCEWANEVDQLLDGFNQPKPDLQFMEALQRDGESKGFLNCEQYHELIAAVSEAKRILKAINDVLEIKKRDQLVSVNDLKQILEDAASLPCCVPECNSLEAHLNSVGSFQKEVQSTLSALNSSSSATYEDIGVLQQLLKSGEKFSLDLPQLEELQNAIMQLTWVQDTKSVLNSGNNLHVDALKNIYKKGQTLHNSKAVESVLITLKGLLSKVQDWEQKVKSSLKDKPSHPISYYEALLEEASQFSITIPTVATLSNTVQQAKDWNANVCKIQANDKHPHYDTLKELLSSAQPLSVRLEQLPQVESRYSAAKAWVDRTSRTFLKKNSAYTLLEVLLPRTSSGSFSNTSKTSKKKYEGEYAVHHSPLSAAKGDRLVEMDLIHEMEKEEKINISKIRKSNIDKQQQDEQSHSTLPVLYCLCRRPESGYMLQCEVCNEWYHANCLHIPKSKLNQDNDLSKDMRFICGSCLRSRRPRLDAIVSLLISLQKVPVAISEGTALHCLAERAITWQKKARELVGVIRAATEEARSQQLRLADIRKKISKWKLEISSEVHMQLTNQADSVLKHYETQLQKEKGSYAGLTDTQRRNAEDALLDGDLLEVTTDESTQLWQLLQIDSECMSYFILSEEDALKTNIPKFSSQVKKSSLITEDNEETSVSSSLSTKKKRKGETTEAKEAISDLATKRKKGSGKHAERKRNSPSKVSRSRQSPSLKESDNKEEGYSDDDKQEQFGGSEDTVCSAPQCIRPMASQISWVQCDLCQQWFHLLCVGLTAESVEKIDIYNCCVCKQKCISERKALISGSADKKVPPCAATFYPPK